jgi:SanA protein
MRLSMDKQKKPGNLKKAAFKVIIIFIVLCVISAIPRYYIHSITSARIYSDTSLIPRSRVAIILGAKVYPNGSLSPLLRDRVNKGIELYKNGRVEKLLMSGDNRVDHYNEPDRMAEFAIAHGVNPADIGRDYAGRRTYDSIYRAKHVFGLDEAIIVSQRSHAERAVFICDKLGIKAYGLSADVPMDMNSSGGTKMLLREFPASILVLSDVYLIHPHPVLGKKEKI